MADPAGGASPNEQDMARRAMQRLVERHPWLLDEPEPEDIPWWEPDPTEYKRRYHGRSDGSVLRDIKTNVFPFFPERYRTEEVAQSMIRYLAVEEIDRIAMLARERGAKAALYQVLDERLRDYADRKRGGVKIRRAMQKKLDKASFAGLLRIMKSKEFGQTIGAPRAYR
jgi:hypothetical protein